MKKLTWSTRRKRNNCLNWKKDLPHWRKNTWLSWRSAVWPETRGSVHRGSWLFWSSQPQLFRLSGAHTKCEKLSKLKIRKREGKEKRRVKCLPLPSMLPRTHTIWIELIDKYLSILCCLFIEFFRINVRIGMEFKCNPKELYLCNSCLILSIKMYV